MKDHCKMGFTFSPSGSQARRGAGRISMSKAPNRHPQPVPCANDLVSYPSSSLGAWEPKAA